MVSYEPVPNGGRPVAANATVLAQECTSADGPDGRPSTTSGARYPGVPMNMPAWVILVTSGACAMPKSITTGTPPAITTFPGLRSRCTTPAACTAARPSASPQASRSSAGPRSGPSCLTFWSSDGPAT